MYRQMFRGLVVAALWVVCVSAGAVLLAPLGWPFELFSHFRLQLAVAALLLVPALLLLRVPKAAALSAVLAAVLFVPDARGLVAAEPVVSCAGQPLVVVTANVRYTNREPKALLDWLAAQRPDVVVLQEVTPEWAAALVQSRAFEHGRILPRRDPYGIALVTRWPMQSVDAVDLAGDGVPSLDARLRVRGADVRVIGTHTRWPMSPRLAALRNLALERAANRARAGSVPTVMVGDLNLSPDSPQYAQLLERSGLRDAFAGRGWQPTWMAGFWPLALRIDHQLVSPALCVERVQVGPEVGSDHRPVIAWYRLPAAIG